MVVWEQGNIVDSFLPARHTAIPMEHYTFIFARFIKKYQLVCSIVHQYSFHTISIVTFSCHPLDLLVCEGKILQIHVQCCSQDRLLIIESEPFLDLIKKKGAQGNICTSAL